MRSTADDPPLLKLEHLDQLWFQVAGTRCNLECCHCFIRCSPHNHSFGFLPLDTVRQHLRDSVAWGVKEYYFTGGEPFLHPQMTEILVETLQFGPATVLTNGTVMRDSWLRRLKTATEQCEFSLEFRVSLDGFSAETNDPIRGEGTFARTLQGVIRLVEHGMLPIITAVRTWRDDQESTVLAGFCELLRAGGYSRPRVKILPTLHLGGETTRTRGYNPDERITREMMNGFDTSQLICHHSRIVTDRGVHVCPILIESKDSLLGQDLASASGPFRLAHGACYTCYQFGAICANPSSAARAAGQPG